MNNTESSGSNSRQLNISPLYLTLAIGIAVLILVCAMILFFQIKDISCEGNFLYSSAQIIDASGITIGDNLTAIQKAKSASLIMSKLPFVSSVHIERKLPHSVLISVTESEASFKIYDQKNNCFLVSAEGVVESQLGSLELADYPEISGIVFRTPTIGKKLIQYTDNTDGLYVLLELIAILDNYGVTGGIQRINVEAVNDLYLNYDGRYDVYLGSMDKIEYKVAYLSAMLKEWDSNRIGVIDLTFDVEQEARFQPY